MDFKLKFRVLRTQEFNTWLEHQPETTQSLVLARLHRISVEGHFGFINHFDGLIELKWKSGLRIYMARISHVIIVALGGGNKNGQSSDIKKAKKTLKQIKNSYINDA